MKYILFLILNTVLLSQVEFSGYFENQIDAVRTKSTDITTSYTKLRIDMDTYPSDHIHLGFNWIVKYYEGQTTFYLDDFLDPNYVSDDIAQLGRIPFPLSDTTYLDNMFIEVGQSGYELILGKQQISPGVGYAWNPTDIFNRKDLFDPTYEQTGVKALTLNMSIGSNSSLTAITQLKDSKENSTIYLQIIPEALAPVIRWQGLRPVLGQ